MVEKPNIKHFDSDDKSLKELGELLANDSSRKIIRAIISKPMFLNEIARVAHEDPPLVKYHMKKLEALGLLVITYKSLTRKGKLHKHYQMIPNLFVTPNHTKEEVKEKGILKKIFKGGVKFVVIGIIGLLVWGFSLASRYGTLSDATPLLDLPDIPNSNSIVYALLVMFILMIGTYLFSKFKIKKRLAQNGRNT